MVSFSNLSEGVTDKQMVVLCTAMLSKYLGVKMLVIEGGPSVSDPAGEIETYVSFKDSKGNGFALGVNELKEMRVIAAQNYSRHPNEKPCGS